MTEIKHTVYNSDKENDLQRLDIEFISDYSELGNQYSSESSSNILPVCRQCTKNIINTPVFANTIRLRPSKRAK